MNQVTGPQDVTADQAAAHDLLCELRTRISTQPLPYQYGVEARALESLWAHESPHFEATRKSLIFGFPRRLDGESADWGSDASTEGAI
jgi:hypothetical protein